MPLHLLGKKSWNVYNADNIQRVRRDEAAAKAREEEEERRMQEVDAERRIQLLRGIHAEPDEQPRALEYESSQGPSVPARERKRRRITGEDDTEREMRWAREDEALAISRKTEQPLVKKSSDAPLVDHAGHIDLFPEERRRRAEKNPERESEEAKKRREYEDQYTMRFSNAAGLKQGLEKPWYSSLSAEGLVNAAVPSKDVWGNEDPRRQERGKARMEDSDPLKSMRKGVKKLREVERERRKWQEERDKELRRLKEDTRRRRRHRDEDEDSLEGFDLEASSTKLHRDDGRASRRYRSRSPLDSPPRSRRHHGGDNSKVRHDERRHRRHHHGHRSSSRERGSDTISQLRREKEEREAKERLRTVRLLEKEKAHAKPLWEKGVGGRYSNQFAHA